ncbi:oxidoreductase [Candidatus Poribacteria bacterium]|nr:oxidoreductase [Candidatus Poribacteria bacterium]
MKVKRREITVLVSVTVLILWFLVSCKELVPPIGKESDETKVLESVEVREYKGEKLSSTNDFRENSIKGPQRINQEDYVLQIIGLVDKPKNYAYGEVINERQNYKKVITLDCVEGWSVDILWEGVLVRDLLAAAKPLASAKIVIFHAYDSYTTSFPIDYIINNNIIMAHKMNNIALPPERGFPFQLAAESKWGYKWIKWITKIELSDDVNYKGYWESRGYSNSGDLNDSFFDR